MRIVVVEDQVLFRELLVKEVQQALGHEIVGIAEDGETALELVGLHKPDVLILDVLIPKLSGILVARTVKERWPKVQILILSNQMDAKTLYQLHKLYLAGFIDKNEAKPEVLREALEAIRQKKRFFSESMQSAVRRLKSDPNAFQKILTPREQEILTHIGGGQSDQQIGELLGLSPTSVQSHRSNILKKLNVNGTPELIKFASEMGFWKPEFKRMGLTDTYHIHD